jgi:hypothetical protein
MGVSHKTVTRLGRPARLCEPRTPPVTVVHRRRQSRGRLTFMMLRDYGESQVPPFCAQLAVSVPTVSATPE